MNRRYILILILLVSIGVLLYQRCPSEKEKGMETGAQESVRMPEVPVAAMKEHEHHPPPSRGKPRREKHPPVRLSRVAIPPAVELPPLTLKVVRARRAGEKMRVHFLLLDNHGRPVQDIAAADFSVKEFTEGAPQDVEKSDLQLLPVGAREPASILLALDYSDSMQGRTDDLEDAVGHFLDAIGRDDRIMVMKFAEQIANVTHGFTADKKAAKKALKARPGIRYATSLHMAMSMAIVHLAAEEPPRVLVVFTDGDDTSSPPEFTPKRIMAAAQEADVQIFTIGLGEEVIVEDLKRIADESRGIFSYAPEPKDLYDIYGRIAAIISKTPILIWPSHVSGPNFEITYMKGDEKASSRYTQP